MTSRPGRPRTATFPDPNGMTDTVPRTTVDWDVEIMDNFRSLWLPTPEYVDVDGRR